MKFKNFNCIKSIKLKTMTDFTEQMNKMNMTSDNNGFVPFSNTFINFDKTYQTGYPTVIPTFGILQLDVNKFELTKKSINFTIEFDNSASMADPCSDNKTKMEHMLFASDNFIRCLEEKEIDASVSFNTFDHTIENVILKQKITSETISQISNRIKKIRPKGSTDIELALRDACKKILHNMNTESSVENVLLLFTDGDTVQGISDKEQLKQILNDIPGTTVITVGCGTQHNFELLKHLGSGQNNMYKFIGQLEEAGLVCGEILDKILNKILKKVTIVAHNGEIYDWKTNMWLDSIETDNIVGECNKTYHVRSLTPAAFFVTIIGTIVETDEPFEIVVNTIQYEQDLTRNKFRQQTLEVLFEVTEFNETHPNLNHKRNIAFLKEIKLKLKELLKAMKLHMDTTNTRDDKFINVLCDDIVMCYKTLGTQMSSVFTCSRQTSQGTQSIHNNTQIPLDHRNLTPLPMTKFLTSYINHMEDEEEEDEDDNRSKNITHNLDLLPPRPPKMQRYLTRQIQQMDNDYNVVDSEEEEDDDENKGAIDACASITQLLEPIKLTKIQKHVGFINTDINLKDDNDDDEEEVLFKTHKFLACDESPNANLKTVTMMRNLNSTPKK